MKHKRLKLDSVDSVLSKAEIKDWFARYFKIPKQKRFLRFTELSHILSYNRQYLRCIVDGRTNMAPEFQVRFSAFVKEYGQPRGIEKQLPIERKEIPHEVYEKFAAAIAVLPTDMAAFYGINKYIYLSVKNGAIPQFRRPTFERLYEKLTGEEFIW